MKAPGPHTAGNAALIQLRSGTRAQHTRLESVPALQRLFAADYTIPEYKNLLQAFLSVFRPL
ncbi:MAG: hypothetical protein WD572_09550 [Gammaproteobacteria bacterium]